MRIILRSILYTIVISLLAAGTGVFYYKGLSTISLLFLILTLIAILSFIISIRKIIRDIDDFTEAVKHHDFSRRYPYSKAGKNSFYKNFNQISEAFGQISKEKDLQYLYLKKILEEVDTAMIAYDMDNEDTLWINTSFRELFLIPEIKNIAWLKNKYKELYDTIIGVKAGENSIVAINNGGFQLKIIINATIFNVDEQSYKIISIHNVSSTMEEIESNAWKGLLNVMTHELMNSVAPVVSLTDTIIKKTKSLVCAMPDYSAGNEQGNNEIADLTEDIELGLETIKRRSEGLLKFSNTYHNLSKTMIPQFKRTDLNSVISDIYNLMKPSLESKGVEFSIRLSDRALIRDLDKDLIEQAVINLITNATYAVKDSQSPFIEIHVAEENGHPFISVIDNGSGVPEDIINKIYIPFFTTRKGGNGIGLSITREIIKLHDANLQLQTKQGEGSAFTILF